MGKRKEIVASGQKGIDMDYDSSSDEETTAMGRKALLSMAEHTSADVEEEEEEQEMEVDEVETKKNNQPKEFKNRQRVMLLCSRGITAR